MSPKDFPAAIVVGENVPANSDKDEKNDPLENYFSWTDDQELVKCFANLPKDECFLNLTMDMVNENPLDVENIKDLQNAERSLQEQAKKCRRLCRQSTIHPNARHASWNSFHTGK